jgi:hypothetical protein
MLNVLLKRRGNRLFLCLVLSGAARLLDQGVI